MSKIRKGSMEKRMKKEESDIVSDYLWYDGLDSVDICCASY